MNAPDGLAERFEAHRGRLRAVAYRMLGSLSDADDAVQEAWLRLSRLSSSDAGAIENLEAWLRTAVARLCLDMLRTRASRREEPLDWHAPATAAQDGDPEQEALLLDSVGRAMLVVLDALAPAERVAFVLHDLFAVPFDEIAPVVGRSPATAKKLASRARLRVRGAPVVPRPSSPGSAASWKRSWPPRAAGTSMRCSPCWPLTSSGGPTLRRCSRAASRCSAARTRWRGRRWCSVPGPGSPSLRWSTGWSAP